jgi:DNA-binding transcriptional LysR family regulator
LRWPKSRRGPSPLTESLSQGLAELERRVGVTLFDRDGRRRTVRPGASPVVAHARQVLGLTHDLAEWADRLRTGRSGALRLGMIDAAAVVHYPDQLRRYRSEHPDVDLRLRVAPSAQLLDLLVAGDLDLVVCVEPPTQVDGIEVTAVLTEDLAVYGPPDVRPGSPATWGPWVLFPAGSHTRAIVVEELRQLGAPIDVVAESHQPEVLREMVQLGVGWTVLPTSQAEHGDRPLQRRRTLTTRRLVLATRAGSVRDPAADQLSHVLADVRPGST